MRQQKWEVGFILIAVTFIFWGAIIPELYHIYRDLPPFKLLAYFDVLALLPMWGLMLYLGHWKDFKNLMKQPKSLFLSFLGAVGQMISMVAFIIGVASHQGLAVSLAYFVLPLFYVVIGFVFFKEKSSTLMITAILVAILSLLFLFIKDGQISWVIPVICLGAALYSSMRKITNIEPISGLTWELSSLFPLAAFYLLFKAPAGAMPENLQAFIGYTLVSWSNIVPLLTLVLCIRYLPFHVIGVASWIAPSLTFLMSIFVWKQDLNKIQLICFMGIWSAMALYMIALKQKKV